MSLTSLSSNSLTRIFECLGDRASTISLLRRTCYKMDNLARRVNFHKVNAINLSVQYFDDTDGQIGLNMALSRKKPKDEKEFILKKNNDDSHFRANNYYVTLVEARWFESYEQSLKYVNTMVSNILEKVKSLQDLRIYNFKVNDAFIADILSFADQLGSIQKLGIYYGNLSASPEQLTKLIEVGQVDSIDLRCSIAPEVLQDQHLQNMANVYINNYEETKACPGITDVTIDGWMRNIPMTINMKNARSTITFGKLWDFIELTTDLKNGESLKFFFGIITKGEESVKLLSQAQRIPEFSWKVKPNDEDPERRYRVIYEHDNGNVMMFKFVM